MRALRRRGLAVRGAKSGPDYIDPGFHAAATGAPGVNLDSWAMPPALLDALAAEQAEADVLVVESAMGLFDGIPAAPGRSGAAADLARRYRVPVVLLLDVSGQSQTAAAIARGFAGHDPEVRIAGVVLNQVASPRHEALCRAAIEALGLPVVGAVYRNPAMGLPERHLGLVQAREHAALEAFIDRLADIMEASLDLDALARAGGAAAHPRAGRRPGHAAARPADRDRRRRGLQLRLSAPRAALALGRGGARRLLAAGRRGAGPRLRRLLAAGRISGAARRAARGGGAVPRRAAAVRRDAGGARRVRRVHGARAGAGGRAGDHPCDDRPARPRDELRQAADEPRLSPGASSRPTRRSAAPGRACAGTSSTTPA